MNNEKFDWLLKHMLADCGKVEVVVVVCVEPCETEHVTSGVVIKVFFVVLETYLGSLLPYETNQNAG